MKIGHLIEYIKINIFVQKSWRKRAREAFFVFFKKALNEVNAA